MVVDKGHSAVINVASISSWFQHLLLHTVLVVDGQVRALEHRNGMLWFTHAFSYVYLLYLKR